MLQSQGLHLTNHMKKQEPGAVKIVKPGFKTEFGIWPM